MTFRNARLRIAHEYAVLSHPLGLLIIIMVATIIITLFVLSIQDLNKNIQREEVEHEISSILIEATTMFEYAQEGSYITLPVTFPSSMRFIVFGSLPQNGVREPTNLRIDENTSNNYYFVMDDGTIRTYHSNARFSNRNLTQIALFRSGDYNLTLDLRSKGGRTYVAIYERD